MQIKQKFEAEQFVRKLKQDKIQRERQIKMQMEAKDNAFLTKLSANLDTKKRVEQMKSKDREMKYNMMMKKLEKKTQERTNIP